MSVSGSGFRLRGIAYTGVILILCTLMAKAQRNNWQPDSTAYQYLTKGGNAFPFTANRLSLVEVDHQRYKNNPSSIRWTIPPHSGNARLKFDVGDLDLRQKGVYLLCSSNHTDVPLSCYVNTQGGGHFKLTEVVASNSYGFHLPCTSWHQSGQYMAGILTDSQEIAQLEHVVSLSFETNNSPDTTILWIDEIKVIEPRGPACVINFNRYRDLADTTITPYLLQRGKTANIDFNYSFARDHNEESYGGISFKAVGFDRIDTLTHKFGWSCSSHGSYYDQLPFISEQNRYILYALDSFNLSGFDAGWVFSIPKDNVTPDIMQEIVDYGQYTAIRRQSQDIQNLPLSNPYEFLYFRPTSAMAGPNLNGHPLLLNEMKWFVDSCVKHRGLIVIDLGTIVDTPSTLYTDVETTMRSDAIGLIDYADSLDIPFINFRDLFGIDTAYVPSMSAGDDYFVLHGLQGEGFHVLDNDVWCSVGQPGITMLTPPLYGNAWVNGDSIIYDPGNGCFDTDVLKYVLTNGALSDTATVRIRRMANVFSGERTYFCSPNLYRLEANVTGGLFPYTFLWSDASTTDSLEVPAGFTYTVTVTDDIGCQVVDSVFLPSRNRPAPAVYANVLCDPGVPVTHVIALADTVKWYADPAGTILLQGGGTMYNGVIDSTTTLFVSIDYGDCESDKVPLLIEVAKPAVHITANPDSAACADTRMGLFAQTGPGMMYQWYRNGTPLANAQDAKYNTKIPGTYTVSVMRITDSCVTVSAPVALSNPDTAAIFTDHLFYFCHGDSIRLFTYASSAFSYSWYKDGLPLQGLNGNEIWVSDSGIYEVQAGEAGKCSLVPSPVTVGFLNCTAGVADYARQQTLMLSPVPVSDVLSITAGTEIRGKRILTLTDLSGAIQLEILLSPDSKREIILPVSNLCQGIYFVSIRDEHQSMHGRFLKL